jgi:oligopeptide/dipeptide ABC transporter ATP-binding protein
VMYGGKLVEALHSKQLVEGGRHPYTRGLLESEPDIAAPPRVKLRTIPGEPPDIRSRHRHGCPFRPRCPNALDVCASVMPPLAPAPASGTDAVDPSHLVACHNPVEPRIVLTTSS